jgi:hypothetical protein
MLHRGVKAGLEDSTLSSVSGRLLPLDKYGDQTFESPVTMAQLYVFWPEGRVIFAAERIYDVEAVRILAGPSLPALAKLRRRTAEGNVP